LASSCCELAGLLFTSNQLHQDSHRNRRNKDAKKIYPTAGGSGSDSDSLYFLIITAFISPALTNERSSYPSENEDVYSERVLVIEMR
jgi:hypothetical protein